MAESGLVLDHASLHYAVLFHYHTLVSFCLATCGMILFVLSLQEGFYAYQLKQLSWTLINILVIVAAGHGFLTALWHCRLWFAYSIILVGVHNLVENLVSAYGPFRASVLHLRPGATAAGFIISAIACFATFYLVSVGAAKTSS